MSFTSDSAPSEARKRGSGGGSPRKHDDLLTGRSDLDAQSSGAPVSGGERVRAGKKSSDEEVASYIHSCSE
jgi:hypothetical protein